jgi:dolichyl-diphosphooligosaccharide--protein glycosyltransferase
MAGFNISATAKNININLNDSEEYSMLTSTNNTIGYVSQGIMLVYKNNTSIPYFYTEISGGTGNVYGYNTSMVGIQSPYYYNVTTPITSSIYYAKQNLVSVSISIYNDSKLAKYNGTVTLTGLYNTYTLNMTDGVADKEIAMGVYYTQVSNNSAYIAPDLNGTVVNSSAHQYFVKNSKLYFTLSNSNTSITGSDTLLLNSAGIDVGLDHLAAGNYTMYSANATLVNMTTITLDKNTSISPVYEKGYNLNITNNLGIPVEYHIKNATMEISTSSSENVTIMLPNLNFTITSSGNFTNSTGAFTYVNTSTPAVTPGPTIHNTTVNLTPTEVYDKISGKVLYYSNGTSVSGVQVILMQNGKQIGNTTSSSTGFNLTKLVPGTYGIYANYTAGGKEYAYFQNVTLQPFKNLTYNIYLVPAYKVTLTGLNNNTSVPTQLTVIGGSPIAPSMYITSAGEPNSIILPGNDTYNLTITNTTVQSGIDVNYSASQTIFLNNTYNKNLTLHKDYVPRYVLIDPTVTGYIGQNVTTTVTIYNKGTTNDTLHLYSGNSTWALSFNPNNFTIPIGKNMSVEVNITIPIAKAGNNTVDVMALINGTSHYIGNITVNVEKGSSYNVSYSKYAEVNGTINMIPVTIKNTNNTVLTINLTVTNSTKLLNNFYIVAYATENGKNVTNVTLLTGQSVTIYILAYGVDGRTLHSVPIDFVTNATINGVLKYQNETITPVLPSATVGTGSSGDHIISNYNKNPAITIYIGIGIIVAALLAGIIGSSIRSRKKR